MCKCKSKCNSFMEVVFLVLKLCLGDYKLKMKRQTDDIYENVTEKKCYFLVTNAEKKCNYISKMFFLIHPVTHHVFFLLRGKQQLKDENDTDTDSPDCGWQ